MTSRIRREPVYPLRIGSPVITEKLVQNLEKKNYFGKKHGWTSSCRALSFRVQLNCCTLGLKLKHFIFRRREKITNRTKITFFVLGLKQENKKRLFRSSWLGVNKTLVFFFWLFFVWINHLSNVRKRVLSRCYPDPRVEHEFYRWTLATRCELFCWVLLFWTRH